AGGALKGLVRRSILPVVADIHFVYRLALMALDAKVHKLRLNPGNIHNKDGVREVVKKAKEQGTPIRIGVNHGSIGDRQPGDVRDEAQRMVDLALSEIKILEDLDFDEIVVSVKAFEVPVMIAAYRRLAKAVPYPLHLGVTEAGTALSGSIRSAAGMSVLLYEGIGDTIRVSLSEDPVVEVKAGFDLLKSLGLRDQGLTLVACPSCGRADIDLIPLAKVAEALTQGSAHARTQCPSRTADLAPTAPTATARRSSSSGERRWPTSTSARPSSKSSSSRSRTSSAAISAGCGSAIGSSRSLAPGRGASSGSVVSTARISARSAPKERDS